MQGCGQQQNACVVKRMALKSHAAHVNLGDPFLLQGQPPVAAMLLLAMVMAVRSFVELYL